MKALATCGKCGLDVYNEQTITRGVCPICMTRLAFKKQDEYLNPKQILNYQNESVGVLAFLIAGIFIGCIVLVWFIKQVQN